MTNRKHLIIGAGTAALAAARKIRTISPEDEIKLVTKEDFPPYCVAVLPYLISGRIQESDLWLLDNDHLRELRFSLARGKEVTKVNPDKKQITYDTGDQESYDTLLIASGSHPLKPNIKGLDEVGFLPFHTLDDFRRLQQRLTGKRDITIYGGGLVAIELAIALLEAGYLVRLVVRSRILRRYFDQEAAGIIKGILASKGAEIYEGYTIEEMRGNETQVEVALSNGTTLSTEAIAIALGVSPSISFLVDTNITLSDGVLVDPGMRTNIADVYAAGDAAEAPDLFTGTPGLSPILPSAISQGKIAGRNMAGEEVGYEGWLQMNILHFFGHRALSVGIMANGDTRVLQDIGEQGRSFKKLVFQGDRLVGASFVNVDIFPGVIHYLVRNRVNIGPHTELLFEKPQDTSCWLMLKSEKEESMSLED
jgi:phenylglyoxylate dehydrogenase epsilon subunit